MPRGHSQPGRGMGGAGEGRLHRHTCITSHSTPLPGPVSDALEMEESLTFETRVSVALVCTRAAGRLQPDRRTWNTSSDRHLCHSRKEQRVAACISVLHMQRILTPLSFSLFVCWSFFWKSSHASTVRLSWRRGSHLALTPQDAQAQDASQAPGKKPSNPERALEVSREAGGNLAAPRRPLEC